MATPKASWSLTPGYPNGWCVRVTVGDVTIGRYYRRDGGEWELDASGAIGRQLVGTCDIRAPRDEHAAKRWVKRHLSEEVRDMKLDADAQVNP